MLSKDAVPLDELVHLLDRTERLLITFHYVERLTPAEIELVLDLSPNRVLDMLRDIRRRITDAVAGRSDQALTAAAPRGRSDAARIDVSRVIASSPL